jgi:uncharacterized protein YggT (Ycf19 family)
MAQQPPQNPQNFDREIVVRDQYQQVMTPTGPVLQSVAVTEQHDRLAARAARYRWVSGLIALVFGILEMFILARITLKVLAANPDNGVVRFIYGFTEPFVTPFLTILPEFSFGTNSVLELSSIVAFIAYMLAGGLLDQLLRLVILRPPSGSSATRIERQG